MTSPAGTARVDRQTVSLVGMRFHTRVGVLPHEREIAQPLEVDVVAVRARAASAYGAGDVLDYRRLYAVVADVASGPVEWLEDAAESIAERPLAYAEVCVERDAAPPADARPGAAP